MILRELTTEEVKSLSNRYGVKQKLVEDFLLGVGGVSISGAYKSLKSERKLKGWNLSTIKAVSDGIVLAIGFLRCAEAINRFFTSSECKLT